MVKRRPIDSDPLRAWVVYSLFEGADVRMLPRGDKETLVKTYYPTIRDVPLTNIGSDELYSIANRLLSKASLIIKKLSPLEKDALKTMHKLSRTTSSEEAEKLAERLYIQMADIPEGSAVSRACDNIGAAA